MKMDQKSLASNKSCYASKLPKQPAAGKGMDRSMDQKKMSSKGIGAKKK